MADSPYIPHSDGVATTASAQIVTGRCRLKGWNCSEAGGIAAAHVILHDGTDTTGPVVAVIDLTAKGGNHGADSEWFPDLGIRINTGIYAERSGTGTSQVIVYTG